MADALAQALRWQRRVEQLQKLIARAAPTVQARSTDSRVLGAIEYARAVLKIEPWSKQAQILEAVEKHPRTAVRSGHKISKSNSAAILALWWMQTGPDATCVMTSSSTRQVRKVLWKEVRTICRRVGTPPGSVLSNDPNTGLQFADGRELVGFSTDDTERMAGISGARVLFVVDEASGVEDEIIEAILGNAAGGVKMVMLGNPTRTSGYFFDAFHSKRQFWHLIDVSSEESPNITGERYIPGLATKEWVDAMIQEWGADSPFVDVRIRGRFPSQAENSVIGIGLVEAAVRKWKDTGAKLEYKDGLLELGVDVARYGDDETVIAPKRGLKIGPLVACRSMDGFEVATKVLEVARTYAKGTERPRVKVDVNGVGSSAFDVLNRMPEVEAVPVNVGESATALNVDGDEKTPIYELLRDQLWFAAKEWLKAGGSFPSDPKLESELIAPTYTFTVRQRIKVESKETLKKKLNPKRSPDRADAICLAIYNPPDPGIVEQGRIDLMRR